MKKQLFVSLLVLMLSNAIAGILMVYVYLPWSEEKSYQTALHEVQSDLLNLNLRLASNDYNYSKVLVDRASFDINKKINLQRPAEIDVPKRILKSLDKDRYRVYMEQPEGPIGILKLNEQSFLIIGPYFSSKTAVKLRDVLAGVLLLILGNSIALWFGYSYLRSRFQSANKAINDVAASVYIGSQENNVIRNVQKNTTELAHKIYQLQNEHKKNLNNQRDLMHAVAHEFRGPMARISFAIDLLTNDENSQNKLQLQQDIESSLDELDALVKEVLNYSRLKDGDQTLYLSNFNIRQSIESNVKKVINLYPQKSFQVITTPSEGFLCMLDQNLVERALLNLIRNAARCCMSKVQITASVKKYKLIINVEDDGNGIPPGKRKTIFEPFTRLENSRSRDSGGAGLGLAIVWGIANRHNGTITVGDSETLGGANFCLSLPLEVEN